MEEETKDQINGNEEVSTSSSGQPPASIEGNDMKTKTTDDSKKNGEEVNAEEPLVEEENLFKEITGKGVEEDGAEVKPVRTEFKKVGFIVNPAAGKGRVEKVFRSQVLPAIKSKFPGVEICAYETKRKWDGIRLAKKYLSQGYDYLVSIGGDGTNNEVINGVMEFLEKQPGTNVIVGFLPLGSGCDFVRTFGMVADEVDKNLETLSQCFTIPCDVGFCEATPFVESTNNNNNNNNSDNKNSPVVSRYFLNSSSFGASGAIMKAVNNSSMIISHDFTYTYHTLLTSLFTPNSAIKFTSSRPSSDVSSSTQLPITGGGVDYRQGKFYIVAIVNGQYFGNNCWVCPYGRLGDGRLDVVLMGDLSFREVLKAFSLIKTGDHFSVPKVTQEPSTDYFYATPANNAIATDEIIIECDGELIGKLPATWSIKKSPFKLVVPKNFSYKVK